MVVSEGFSVFIGFEEGDSRRYASPGKIECSGFQEGHFRHSGKPFAHHNTNIEIEINIA